MYSISDAPLGLQREEREPHKTHTCSSWTKRTCETEFPSTKTNGYGSSPQLQKRAPRNLCLACLRISDACTHELGPVLIPVTRNSTNPKYYNSPHTPVSLPYQRIVNISYKRLLRGQLLPLLAARKLGTQADSFPVEQNGAGDAHPGEHYRNIMFYSTGSLRAVLALWGHLSHRPSISSQIEKPGPFRAPSANH